MGKWLGRPHEEIPRCEAKTRSGGKCGHYSMKNGRCRYHGGKSTGARKPYRNIKHGYYTKQAIDIRKKSSLLIKLTNDSIEKVERLHLDCNNES